MFPENPVAASPRRPSSATTRCSATCPVKLIVASATHGLRLPYSIRDAGPTHGVRGSLTLGWGPRHEVAYGGNEKRNLVSGVFTVLTVSCFVSKAEPGGYILLVKSRVCAALA